MDELAALVGFSFVSSVTPGPNNVLLWASGAAFGLRRTIPHVFGTAVGIGAMALAVAAGLGAVIATIPELAVAMRVAGTVYLLYLAYQIARSNRLEARVAARPLGVLAAATFQLVNPKAWVFAVGAVTTFRPTELPADEASILVALTMMLVIVPTASLWAVAGGALNRLVADDRAHRLVSLALAGLVVVTIASVWI